MQERMVRMEAAGLDSFKNYSLPQAIIRFKQGFGRLIRSREDKGIFCVLDCRIFSKYYGREFEKSLPEMKKIIASSPELAAVTEQWLST
jgi:ATP-dependent DNA helicase DinG